MIFRQFIHEDLGCASYLIGDENAGVAAVVDPKLDVEDYLALARYMGVEIKHILETHNHADHVSGHGRLAAATGATIHIHRLVQPEYAHEPFDDGWELELGAVRVKALHTPGHRPEHTVFALTDTARGPEPWAVLTGDTLFVGDIARPDLAVEKTEGARGMFRSLHEKLLALPDDCEVWPGHLGGSLCGGPGMDMKVASTIGYERAHNALLGIADEDEFVEAVTGSLGPQPPNFKNIVAINHGPLVTAAAAAQPLSAEQVAARLSAGALVVDVRRDDQFDAAHIPGALSNPAIRAGFGTKLGWIAADADEIVMVGVGDDDATVACKLAASVGLRNVRGYLAGGMASWSGPTAATARIDVRELLGRVADLQLVDVREQAEWDAGRIPGSLHMPYHDIREVPIGLDPKLPIAVICSSGQRSAVAASILRRLGAKQVIHVTGGGVGTWQELGGPVELPEAIAAAR